MKIEQDKKKIQVRSSAEIVMSSQTNETRIMKIMIPIFIICIHLNFKDSRSRDCVTSREEHHNHEHGTLYFQIKKIINFRKRSVSVCKMCIGTWKSQNFDVKMDFGD